MDDETKDILQLGGNIELTGFKDIDRGTMVVVKKIVGNYTRRYSEIAPKLEKVSVIVKGVHKTEGSEKYEIHSKVLIDGKPVNAEVTDRNLFFALNKVLEKVENLISK